MRTLPRDGMRQNYERIDDPFWQSIRQLVHTWS
jgi:hypothetical protein